MFKVPKKRTVVKRKSLISYSREILFGSAILFSILVGVTGAIFVYQSSAEKTPATQENFLQRASTPAFSQVYHVKKVQRNGKDVTFLVKMGKKENLNSNKKHPTKTSRIISGPE